MEVPFLKLLNRRALWLCPPVDETKTQSKILRGDRNFKKKGRIKLPAYFARFGVISSLQLFIKNKEAMEKIPLKGDSTAELLSVSEMLCWTYGLPFATTLPNGEVMVVYYSGSTESMGIDWVRLSCE